MSEVFAMVLILVLAGSGYAAGRVHGQFSYRLGFRYGYRQGYFDGDRASWNRRRRELQAAVASVLKTPAEVRSSVYPADGPVATTYAGAAAGPDPDLADASLGLDAALGFDAALGRHSVMERGPGGRVEPPRPRYQRTGSADDGTLAEAGHAT
jgi:hypothetical protein